MAFTIRDEWKEEPVSTTGAEYVEQSATELDPRLAAYRRMTYSTALALEEMRQLNTARAGVKRLLKDCSVLWLLSRPFVRCGRAIRRLWKPARPSP